MARAVWTAGALGLSALFLLAGIGGHGIWDPVELERAELARRIAVALFGADLGVEGRMPTLSDLGSGELGFTSMAWGFATFGLHDWAGRLPLALWALAGAMALYAFVARMASPRAGLLAVLALVTMPAYFVQARTMLGDAVSMAAFAMAFCGLAGAWLEARAPVAAAFAACGLAGLGAGYLSRGALLGVAAPALGVGLAWLVVRLSADGGEAAGRRAAAVGAACLAVGAGAAYAGLSRLSPLAPGQAAPDMLRVVGFQVVAAPPEATFDLVVRDLGHALFPWSALLPFAFGRLLWQPEGPRREMALRVLLLAGSAVCYGAHAWLAPLSGTLPFVGVALLAAVAALCIDDRLRGAAPSALVGAGTLALVMVLWRDLETLPHKALAAYGLSASRLPAALEAPSGWLLPAALVFGVGGLYAWTAPVLSQDEAALGRDAGRALRDWLRRRIEHYEAVLAELGEIWNGNLAFGALVVEAALIGLGAMLLIGGKAGWETVTRMPLHFARVGLNAWWVLPLAALALPLAVDLSRAGYAFALARLCLPRAGGVALAALAAGALMSFAHHPALAAQLSPKQMFTAYADHHAPGEPLGLLGLSARAGRYYAGGETVETLASPRAAIRWLRGGPDGGRRWLVFRRAELPELNSLYRQASGGNVPVVQAQGDIVLASNALGGARDANPLAGAVRDAPPAHIQHPLRVMFSDKLEALGWEVSDDRGAPVDYVVPGRAYQLRFYYRVLAPLGRNYQAFLHIDGHGRRHNGDHEVLGGAYRMTWWLPGDVIVDAYDLTLPPNFTPDDYVVYFGFFAGGDRLEVTRGKHHDNRVVGGMLSVR